MRNLIGAVLASAVLVFDALGAAEPSTSSLKGVCGLSDETFAAWRTDIRARRQRWLEKAEASKPALHRRTVVPMRLVKPVPDARAFQGWSLANAGTAESVFDRPLSAA